MSLDEVREGSDVTGGSKKSGTWRERTEERG